MANIEVSAPKLSAGRGGLFWMLRIMVTLQTAALLGQAIFAGMLIEGQVRALHGMGAGAVHLLGLLQRWLRRSGHAPSRDARTERTHAA